MFVDYKLIGEKLKNARKSVGLSQEELAFRANLTREYISQIENGKKHPSLEILFILQGVLNVPFYELFSNKQMNNYYDLKLMNIFNNSEDLEKELFLKIIYLIKDTIDNFKM